MKRKLSSSEKRTLIAGAVVVGLTVLIAWILVPLARKWHDLGNQLEPKLRHLEALRTRADGLMGGIALRASLVRHMGALVPSGESAGKASQKATVQPGKESKASPSPPKAAAAPRMEARLEKILKERGARVRAVSPKGVPQSARQLKCFRPVAVKIDFTANADSLVKVLHEMEEGSLFIRVDKLKVHQDLSKPGELNVTMEVSGYELQEET